MEKAVFYDIKKANSGSLSGRIKFENAKSMPVTGYVLEEVLNNKECQVLRKKGQILKILVDGMELAKLPPSNKGNNNHGKNQRPYANQRSGSGQARQNVKGLSPVQSEIIVDKKLIVNVSDNVSGKPKPVVVGKSTVGVAKNNADVSSFSGELAIAPYNFVPLNDMPIVAEFASKDKLPPFDRYFDIYLDGNKEVKLYTGYINYDLITMTPFYIRNTIDEPNKYEKNNNPGFFSPAGRYKIPGSSVRGMTRNMVETVSWGKFENFEDRNLYYRMLADNCKSVRKEYQKNMSSFDKRSRSVNFKFNAGYLTKDGFVYKIIPAKVSPNGKQFKQDKKADEVREFVFEKNNNGSYLVVSGHMQGKKRDWLINPPDESAKPINIPDEDEKAYENDCRYTDPEGKKDGDLFRQLSQCQEDLVPCFYVRWKDSDGNERVSFGHTGYFRLAYKKSIGDHVPAKLGSSEMLDLPGAVFGEKSSFSTRVFFEDAEIVSGQDDVLMKENSPKILSSPKPTTFQHYLKQNSNNKETLLHWNSETNIRGYKYYWHRDNHDWSVSDSERDSINEKLLTVIIPVKPGVEFKGRIRFENLSEVELGALLFVLELPTNHYHKLGMGKPLGLGSVSIKPKLFVSDRKQRYTSLFNDNRSGWQLAETACETDRFKLAFEGYILSGLAEYEKGELVSLWETERLSQLKVMLDWDNTKIPDWVEKTRYMEIEHPEKGKEFKDRRVLADPSEYV